MNSIGMQMTYLGVLTSNALLLQLSSVTTRFTSLTVNICIIDFNRLDWHYDSLYIHSISMNNCLLYIINLWIAQLQLHVSSALMYLPLLPSRCMYLSVCVLRMIVVQWQPMFVSETRESQPSFIHYVLTCRLEIPCISRLEAALHFALMSTLKSNQHSYLQ